MARNARFDGPFFLVDVKTRKAIESHPNLDDAEKALRIINQHNERVHSPIRYEIEERAPRYSKEHPGRDWRARR